jgi:DNA repair protein RecO (recombination protein O)
MEKLVKEEAIILKKSYVGDEDLSVLIYGKKIGKENIYIPKGQLIKHPYVPILEPSNWFKGVFIFKKDKIFIEDIDKHKLLALEISKDLNKFYLLFYIIDTFNKYVGFPDERLFILLKKSLYYLSIGKNIALHQLNFLAKFINLYGIFPELEFCGICGKEINRNNYAGLLSDFSTAVCKKCKKRKNNINFSLNFNDILILKILKSLSFKELENFNLGEKRISKLKKFLEFYIKKQIE